MPEHTPPTAAELAALRERFTPDELYRCMVCRREMVLYREDATHRHYHCPSGRCGDDTDRHLRKGEPRIVALIDDVARLRVLFAWEAGELTEKQAADLIANGDRLDAREMRLQALEMAKALAPKRIPAHTITDEDEL